MGFSVFPPISSAVVSSATPATGYTYQRFNTSGTFALPSGYNSSNPLPVDIIAVGGGGAGGNYYYGGGGGAGEVVLASASLTSNCSVTIGAGGAVVTGTNTAGIGGTGGTTQIKSTTGLTFNYIQNAAVRYGNTGTGQATGFSASGTPYVWSYYDASGTQRGTDNSGNQINVTGNTSSGAWTDPYGSTVQNDWTNFQHIQWNNANVENTLTHTVTGLTVGTNYTLSFWYAFGFGSPSGETIGTTGFHFNGNKVGATPTRNKWTQFQTTWTATTTSVTMGIYGTNNGVNTFLASYNMGFMRAIESTNATPLAWGFAEDGSALYSYSSTAGASATLNYPLVARAFGGGGGGAGGSSTPSVHYGAAPALGGSGGGNASYIQNSDNIYSTPAAQAGTSAILRNSGGGSANAQFPYGGTAVVQHNVSGGGGGATSAGSIGDWFAGIGGKGGTGYDANSWAGSALSLTANMLAGGGAGWGKKGVGVATHGAGIPQVTAPYNVNTVMTNAVPVIANTGAGGAGASGVINTATAGATGTLLIRWKA